MVAQEFHRNDGVSDGAIEPPVGHRPTTHTLSAPLAAALVFVACGAVLVLEILAVRLLAPYVGLTLETTTSIIGAALAGIAVGAAVGGWLADRTDERKLLAGLLIGGGLLTLLIVPLVRVLGPGARDGGDVAVLGITLITLVPAAAVLSAVTPTVARLRLHDLGSTGSIVGGISAWATAGALVGTFGTGFVLVPLVSSSASVLGIGVALALMGAVLAVRIAGLGAETATAVVVGALALGALTAAVDTPCDRETDYHCVNVEVDPVVASGRTLLLDDVRLVTAPDEEQQPAGGNALLFASDRPLPPPALSGEYGEMTLERAGLVRFAADAEPLSDDFAPADQQLTIPFS